MQETNEAQVIPLLYTRDQLDRLHYALDLAYINEPSGTANERFISGELETVRKLLNS
jgi:hypothetical protein